MDEKQVVDLMLSSKSEEEWNINCDKVKSNFGEGYPAFWFSAVLLAEVPSRARIIHGW